MVKRRSSKSRRASKGIKRKHTRKVKSSVVKRRKSRTSRKTRKSNRKGKTSKNGGAIRFPSEYFGKNSGRYGGKTSNSVSFPHTDLRYTA